MSTKEKIRYGEYVVCKADFDRLHEIDMTEAKLKNRLELAIKTLSNLELTDTQNVKLTQRYIDTTYPNSIKNIKEKRNEILSKYKRHLHVPEKLSQTVYIISFILIALAIVVFSILSIKNAAGF